MAVKNKILPVFALFILAAQFFFWHGIGNFWPGTKSVKPLLEIVPAAPSQEMIKASSFGDEQLTFRYNGYMMQFLGDTFGRVTPLKNYDYSRLYRWWELLDDIDPKSSLIAYVVAYYYSASQNVERDVPYVVDFLEHHADKDPSANWWWYSQAVYNAKYKMKDTKRALEIAKKLADLPKDLDIPIWTRQLQAFMYEEQGEYKEACDIIVNVVRDFGDNKLTEGEMNFIYYFIKERLKDLVKMENSLKKDDISPECHSLMQMQKESDMKEKVQELSH